MGLSDPVFLTVREIHQFLDGFRVSKGASFNESDNPFVRIKNELSKEISHFQRQEREVYIMFGVKDLLALQKKIDEINAAGLTKLSARAYNQSNLGAEIKKRGYTMDEILEGLKTYIINHGSLGDEIKQSLSDPQNPLFDMAISEVTEVLQKEINKQRDLIAGRLGKDSVHSANWKIKREIKTLFTSDALPKKREKLLKTYKRELKAVLVSADILKNQSTFRISFDDQDLSIIEKEVNGGLTINNYPYFDLTEEEKVIALNNRSGEGAIVWNKFKQGLKALAPKYSNEMELALESMGPAAFIESSAPRVQGVLGELQLMVIAYALTEKRTNPEFVGNILRADNKEKLGTDVLLKNIGIQVKNYSGYGEDVAAGYWLKKSKGLSGSTLINMFANKPGVDEMFSYFSAIAYNQPIRNAVAGYKDLYKAFSSEKHPARSATAAIMSQNIGEFFTFSEACEAVIGSSTITGKFEYDNAFFFFGGKTIIPVSYFLRAVQKRVNDFFNALKSSGTAARNFYFSSSYAGEKYSLKEAKQYSENGGAPTMDSVVSQMSFSVSFNIHLSDLNLKGGGPVVS